jgi:hypothetical protein
VAKTGENGDKHEVHQVSSFLLQSHLCGKKKNKGAVMFFSRDSTTKWLQQKREQRVLVLHNISAWNGKYCFNK